MYDNSFAVKYLMLNLKRVVSSTSVEEMHQISFYTRLTAEGYEAMLHIINICENLIADRAKHTFLVLKT